MKIIIGLGNPGKKYEETRHNLGFLFLDYLKEVLFFPEFKNESRFISQTSTGIINKKKIILVKPQTFMNLSGEAIVKIMSFYKILPQDIIVIYDDKDMNFGQIKIKEKGSSGGHNGVKSIIHYIGENRKRVKVGIGKNENYETSDWVLSKFQEKELFGLENNIFIEIENIVRKL